VTGTGNAGITFGVNHDSVSHGGKLFRWITTPKGLRFGYARYGEVAALCGGQPTIEHDPFEMIERVTATARGICIHFNTTVDAPSPDRVSASGSGRYIANVIVDE
jgi:hypothetical protein